MYMTARRKIYLFGDSITEESFNPSGGWGASLADHYSRWADVVLRGYSGYNTRWALKVLDRVFPEAAAEEEQEPLAVVVFFGANDSCLLDRYAAFQHVPLDEYKHNLTCICSLLKNRWPTALILLVTPPPIDEAARLDLIIPCRHPYMENPSGLPERTNEAAGVYAKACVDVASACGTPVVDIWTKMQEVPDWGKLYLRYSSLPPSLPPSLPLSLITKGRGLKLGSPANPTIHGNGVSQPASQLVGSQPHNGTSSLGVGDLNQ
ncbi:hypothetical protein Dimus_032681 [Dionaea muscipula]